MEIIEKPFDAVWVFKPKVFEDHRGYFFESYSKEKMNELGFKETFIQDNESFSVKKGVLRGLHFQSNPFAQGKLIRVIKGSVLDVAVDIRNDSPTYGQHFKLELSAENRLMMYVPVGFAHGFVTLEDNTLFQYKCTNYYSPKHEGGIAWDDKELNIDWTTKDVVLSEKDKTNTSFADFRSPF